jgi:hypothetical protein
LNPKTIREIWKISNPPPQASCLKAPGQPTNGFGQEESLGQYEQNKTAKLAQPNTYQRLASKQKMMKAREPVCLC